MNSSMYEYLYVQSTFEQEDIKILSMNVPLTLIFSIARKNHKHLKITYSHKPFFQK